MGKYRHSQYLALRLKIDPHEQPPGARQSDLSLRPTNCQRHAPAAKTVLRRLRSTEGLIAGIYYRNGPLSALGVEIAQHLTQHPSARIRKDAWGLLS